MVTPFRKFFNDAPVRILFPALLAALLMVGAVCLVIFPMLKDPSGVSSMDGGMDMDDIQTESLSDRQRISAVSAGILLLVLSLMVYIARQAILADRMRKTADSALHRSEDRFRGLVDSLPQVVFEINEKGDYTFVNRTALDIWGYTESDIEKGLNALQLLIPEDRLRAAANMRRVLEGETIGNTEYIVMKKDGSTIPVFIRSTRILHDGKPVGLRGIAIDISEQKRAEVEKAGLERQFQQAQRMETIGTLAGGIAHDFNNILAAIIGYADLAKGEVPKDHDLFFHLEQILKAGFRAKELVKQILRFSRQREQDQKPLLLTPLIKETVRFLRASLPSTIDIQTTLPAGDSMILADAIQIHQVIMNLCANAAHAMRETGGTLEILLTREELSAEASLTHPDLKEGKYLRLRIKDSGTGMSPEILGRIFDPFFSTRERGEGTGMGLAVAHGIVKSHRGAIRAASTPGQGTTMDVYLPIREEGAEARSENNVVPPKGNERILFVDDERFLVEIWDAMLKRLGYEVVCTDSSLDALEIFKNNPDRFDIVITDLTLPKMTGIQLSEKLLRIRSDIPVILCTGFGDQLDREALKAVGIVDIIFKPPVIMDLARALRRALDADFGRR